MSDWPANELLGRFVFERGEGRHKHKWNRDEAGFHPSERGPVGKCHNSITKQVALQLLRSGIVAPNPYTLGDLGQGGDDTPHEIYNIYRGVPYVAVPTRPGVSYHGYPWRGRMSATIREALRQRAEDEGTLPVFKKWLKQYEEN